MIRTLVRNVAWFIFRNSTSLNDFCQTRVVNTDQLITIPKIQPDKAKYPKDIKGNEAYESHNELKIWTNGSSTD